ncbi:MAG: hypothetical protein WBZ24_02770 [Anaerolineales bacterium]
MYRWIVLLHVLSVLGFVLLHGASAMTFMRLRREADPERVKALLALSVYPATLSWLSLGMLLLSGIALGFMGGWWSSGWIWASLGVLILMILAMGFLGSRSLNVIRADLGLPSSYGDAPPEPEDRPPVEVVHTRMAELPAWPLMGVGAGGLAILTWLMMFKPF